MTSYRRFIPPLVLIGGAAAVSVFALLMLGRLRDMEKGRQKAKLDDWEDEGGSVAKADAAAP